MAHVIVIGNQKGGSGKSTTAMHVIVSLLQAGHTVGSIDLDFPQSTLTRYLENRSEFAVTKGLSLAMPAHRMLERSIYDNPSLAQQDEESRLATSLAALDAQNDFIVIDTPGSDSFLSKLGHSYADTLITPLNDSFIDLDLLAKIDPETYRVIRPSGYSAMVWEQKKARAVRDGGSIDWIVMRNRLSMIDSRNTRAMEEAIAALSKRIGFRVAPGFGERVIFRELFLKGLTLLDLRDPGSGVRINMSHVAARQEVRALLETIGLGRRRARASFARVDAGRSPP